MVINVGLPRWRRLSTDGTDVPRTRCSRTSNVELLNVSIDESLPLGVGEAVTAERRCLRDKYTAVFSVINSTRYDARAVIASHCTSDTHLTSFTWKSAVPL